MSEYTVRFCVYERSVSKSLIYNAYLHPNTTLAAVPHDCTACSCQNCESCETCKNTNEFLTCHLEKHKFSRFLDVDEDTGLKKFRESTIFDDDLNIVYDMDKARDQFRSHVRIARAPILSTLDIEYMRADEAQNTEEKAIIAGKKSILRDYPDRQSIVDAADINALIACWDDNILGPKNF